MDKANRNNLPLGLRLRIPPQSGGAGVIAAANNTCHNGFPPRLGRPQKLKWNRHRSFLYGCDRSPGTRVSKLGTEIPNQNNDTTGLQNWIENLKSGSSITCEEGLAPSQRPFENGTK